MSVRDQLYLLVHEYPGGGRALAPRMRVADSTLRSMANPNCDSHDWPLKRFEQAMALTGDLRPLEALCQEFNGVFLPMGKFDGMAPGRLLKVMQQLTKEFADIPVRVSEIMKDGVVRPREVERLTRDVYELQQAAAAVQRMVETLCVNHVRLPEDERPG